MGYIVSTTQSVEHISEEMQAFLEDCGYPYVPREKRSLTSLTESYHPDGIIIWETTGPVLYIHGEKFFFHPSMAKNRINAYRKFGTPDLMIRASRLEKGDDFLDCTLGLGSDSIVAAYFSETGRITGLESEKVTAMIVKWGMKHDYGKAEWLNETMKKIEVIAADHFSYLQEQPDNSYDVIYFDPMFQQPLHKSNSMSPLRQVANHAPLNPATITEACRVARKTVVMKERCAGDEFARLGFQDVIKSSNKKIAYGVINV